LFINKHFEISRTAKLWCGSDSTQTQYLTNKAKCEKIDTAPLVQLN